MTSLRTIWGCQEAKIQSWPDSITRHFQEKIQHYIDNKTVIKNNGAYFLSQHGKLLADNIAMELFFEEEND